jgi:hypothetical protein
MKVTKQQAQVSKLISDTAKEVIASNKLVRFCVGSDVSQSFFPIITMSSYTTVAVVLLGGSFDCSRIRTTFACTTKYRFKSVINNSFSLARLAHCDSRFEPNFVSKELDWATCVARELLTPDLPYYSDKYVDIYQSLSNTESNQVKTIVINLLPQ